MQNTRVSRASQASSRESRFAAENLTHDLCSRCASITRLPNRAQVSQQAYARRAPARNDSCYHEISYLQQPSIASICRQCRFHTVNVLCAARKSWRWLRVLTLFSTGTNLYCQGLAMSCTSWIRKCMLGTCYQPPQNAPCLACL